jgi:hypothetical protein
MPVGDMTQSVCHPRHKHTDCQGDIRHAAVSNRLGETSEMVITTNTGTGSYLNSSVFFDYTVLVFRHDMGIELGTSVGADCALNH